MSDEIDISTDMIDLVVMQEDGCLRVDMIQVENSPKIHYATMFRIYSSDDPVYKKLLELTDITKPGDAYSFSLERTNQRKEQ